MMSTEVSRIIGWSPPDNEDYVNIPIADALLPLQNPTFHISETNPVRRLRRTTTGIFHHAPSPASSVSEHSSDESPAGKRADVNGKHNDPAWVARPRNEFILFRCDYVRKHSREGKRVRRAPGAEAEKTLSKQAAEAWHHLPPEERLYWKEQANGERNEHARRYPDYRYRPKKSATGRRRQTRCSPTKPESTPSIEKITPVPSQGVSDSKFLTSNASVLVGHSGSSRGAPTRHASVPHFNVTDAAHRRLRSTASAGWIGSVPSHNDQVMFASSSREFTRMPRLDDEAAFISPEYAPHAVPQSNGSMLLSTSSLLNWNGARMVSAPLQPTQFLSSTSVSISSHLEMSSTQALTEYTTGGNPEPASESQMYGLDTPATQYTTQGDIWMSQLHYPCEQDPSADVTQEALASGSHSPHEAANCAAAREHGMYGSGGEQNIMAEYGVTLHPDSIPGELLQGSNPDKMFAMDTDDYFNPNY